MAAAAQKVSFTVRRPSPVSRASSAADSDGSNFKIPAIPRRLGSPLGRSNTGSPNTPSSYYDEPDSSDEEDEKDQDELVTGFDKFGVQRANKKRKLKEGPLVIPALKNKDWREVARKRRAPPSYAPPSAQAGPGANGIQGGMGLKDTINNGPVISGLQMVTRVKVEEQVIVVSEDKDENKGQDVKMEQKETDEQRALRAILAEAEGGSGAQDGPAITILPTPVSEGDALKQDVEELPDEATLDDYARVPVHQFGAALLRGMGWKEGTAATRKPGKGLVEPYLPQARPALLGLGAKEQEVYDDGSGKKGKKRNDMRYMPFVKKEGENGGSSDKQKDRRAASQSPSRKGEGSSRRGSRSPGRRHDSERRKDDRKDNDRDRRSDYDRERRRDGERRDRDRERDRYDDSKSSRSRDDRRDTDRRDSDRYDSDRARSEKRRDRSRDSSRRHRD